VVVVIPTTRCDDAVRSQRSTYASRDQSGRPTSITGSRSRASADGKLHGQRFYGGIHLPFAGSSAPGSAAARPEGLAEFLEAKSINLPMGYEVP